MERGSREDGIETPTKESPLPHSCSVLVEKLAPEEMRAGETFTYEIRVTNHSRLALGRVVLVETPPSAMELLRSRPAWQSLEAGKARWQIGPLPARGRVRLRITCRPRRSMRFESHTSLLYAHGA